MLSQTYPIRLACAMLECAPSSYYYHAHPTDQTDLKQAIEIVAADWPTYGYRRVTAQICRDYKIVVNHKCISRLMAELGLQVKRKANRRRTTDSQHAFPRYPNLVQDLEISRPDQVWVSDLTYIRLRQEFVYLAVIMYVFYSDMLCCPLCM